MKKVTLTFLLLCAFFGGFAHQNTKAPMTLDASVAPDAIFGWHFRLFRKVEVYYGAGPNCDPSPGICGTGGGEGMVAAGFPREPGTYAAIDDDGNFCLYFSDGTGNAALGGSLFIQAAPLLIDSKLAISLKINPYVIKAGSYPVEHRGKEAVVIFTTK